MSLEKLISAINKHEKFILCSHVNLEGDALGSQLAMASLLRKLGKKVYLVDSDKPPHSYKFLPGIKQIKQKINGEIDFDVVIFLDCSDKNRSGKIVERMPKKVLTLNIDHHISNSYFADVNWVDPHSSSAAEMVYRIFKKLNLKFSHSDAILLYVGMLTDTGSFRFTNTTSFTHEAVADLLRFNISVSKIYRRIYESTPFADAVLLNKVLSTLQKHRGGKVVWMEMHREMLGKRKIKVDQSENILNFARSIERVEVILLFKQLEDRDETRVNFRSSGKIDVNKIAAYFGGGGHKSASGCTIKGNIETARELVLNRLDKEFDRLRK